MKASLGSLQRRKPSTEDFKSKLRPLFEKAIIATRETTLATGVGPPKQISVIL